MLQERPLSLKLIFHYYNQINRKRDRIIWMRDVLTNFLCFLFLFLFFFLLLFFQHVAFLFFFFSFFLFASVCSSVCCSFVLVFFFFLLLSIPAFFFVLFVYVVLLCFKLSFTVTRFILSPRKTLLAQAPNRTCYILT